MHLQAGEEIGLQGGALIAVGIRLILAASALSERVMAAGGACLIVVGGLAPPNDFGGNAGPSGYKPGGPIFVCFVLGRYCQFKMKGQDDGGKTDYYRLCED